MKNIENFKNQFPNISNEDIEAIFEAFKYREEKNKIKSQKKNESMESILKKYDWKSMIFEESYISGDVYNVITLKGEQKRVNAYYCDNCGYVIGKLMSQKFYKPGFLSSRGGTNYKCGCGLIINEDISLVG
jgi:hypothetical protein